jgi:methionyl-tRNA formyltransferase
MRIIFMGTPDFAVPSLDILLEQGHTVAAVVTAPDRPAGRGKQLRPSPVKLAAERHRIPVFQPEKLRDPSFVQAMHDFAPDLAVVVAFRMLPEMVWSIPRLGTFNLHASLLPDYRGAAPINWALINGEARSGATTFLIDDQIDTGNVLLQHSVEIPQTWTAGDLHDHLMIVGAQLVQETVAGLAVGTLKPKPQDEQLAVHAAPKIFKDDCRIDWQQPAEVVYHFVRGLSPYPTAWSTLEGALFKIYGAELVQADSPTEVEAGTLRADAATGTLEVACGQGWIRLLDVQVPGKKRMSAADFLRGRQQLSGKLE